MKKFWTLAVVAALGITLGCEPAPTTPPATGTDPKPAVEKPAEGEMTEEKPAEDKPTEEKPAETTPPAEGDKPADPPAEAPK